MIGRMETVAQIFDHIGRDKIMSELDVAPRTIRHYAALNELPATWFDVLESMAQKPLPRGLFSFAKAKHTAPALD
jgi:hypothetical protein